MTPFALQHILESSLFCALLFVVARWFTKGASARHAIGLVGVGKFVIPSLLLAPSGARLAFFWPAAPWLSSWVSRVSALVSHLGALIPARVTPGAARMLVVLWAMGAMTMAALWFVRLKKNTEQFKPANAVDETALVEAMSVLPVRLPLRIAYSQAVNGPALHGVWHPVITVPSGLSCDLSAREFQAVLLHELAHARRFDNLAAVFVRAILCLFWFNPLLWLVERWLHTERERACDELVLAMGIGPRVYAAGILKVCRFQVLGTAPGVSAMSGSDLKSRLESILLGEVHRRSSYAPRLFIAVFAFLMTLAPLAGGYCSQCVSNGQPGHSSTSPSR